MDANLQPLPDDIEALKAALRVARAEAGAARSHADAAQAELAVARAKARDDQALIAHLKLTIEKLKPDKFGSSSERSVRLLNQRELQLEVLEATATEDELAAVRAAAKTSQVTSFERRRPPGSRSRAPAARAGDRATSLRLRRLWRHAALQARRRRHRDDRSDPAALKVIAHVREKFSCRNCEKISQAPAPFHVVARGWAGPSLLAMIVCEKHQPLNRQAERYAREGVPLSLSTLADQVETCAGADAAA